MSRTLFTADTHFYHDGIRERCARPWGSIEEMNAGLIAAWNAVARPNDIVWVVGDFAYKAADLKRVGGVFNALNGQKHLIIGNHDDPDIRALPWKSVADVAEISVEGQRIFLSHYAHRTWPGQRRGTWQLFGHSHGRLPGTDLSTDVGVDCWGYCPVTIQQIQQRLVTQPRAEMEGDIEMEGPQP
jgi:calcineurin-like phosphoesterase family protein